MSKYDWDLENLLENKPLDFLYQEWKTKWAEIIEHYKIFIDTLDNFKKWIKLTDEMEILSNRFSNYISNKANENIIDQEWIGWGQKVSNESSNYSVALSDFENIILKNETKIFKYLQDKDLKEYARSFDLIIKTKPHTLLDIEEKLISKISKSAGGVDELYNSLINGDIKFQDVLNKNNKRIKLKTQSDVFKNLKSPDRILRRNVWISFNNAFYSFRNTLTHSLYYNYLELNTSSKIRNFDDYIHACAFSDEIDVKLIPHIYSNVKNYKGSYNTYLNLRNKVLKKIINVDDIKPWDGYLDLSKDNKIYEPDEAEEIIINSLALLGSEYVSVLKRAFDERWISWMPKENKTTGAYSIGGTTGLSKYFILMNYDYSIDSVYTLAHELGHSLNSYYYGIGQKIYQSTSIFCAEVASITNEVLLSHYLLNKAEEEKDSKTKVFILDQLISGFFATTTRQIIFSNFEYDINNLVNNDESITYDVVKDKYLSLINEYIGVKNLKKYLKPPYSYSLATILRISHFYAGNFYVYKYAIGQIVGLIIANKIIKKETNALENYFKFLKSGTSLSPIETIKLLGIDLYEDKPWILAKEIIDSYIKIFNTETKKMLK